MSASPLLNHLSIADACLSSLPSLFTCKPSHSSLHFRSNPITLTLHKPPSSLSLFISLKRKLPLLPLVAQTSDWARQEEEEEFVDEDEEDENLDGEIVAEGEGRSYSEPPEEAKLFVGNLPFDIDSEKLAELFDPAGVVEVAEVIYNRETDQSRGFGFVTMSTVKEAEKAVEMFHRYELSGRPLTVNKAAPRGSRVERAPRDFESSLKIYVGNLAWEVDDARLEQVFSEHGKVVDAKVVYDRETGRSRGFGFVTMAVKAEMNDAIAALDGENLNGRAIRVNAAEERPPRRNSF